MIPRYHPSYTNRNRHAAMFAHLSALLGAIVTAGGRVLSVVARGADIDSVAERAYEAAGRVRFEGMQYRRDIGHHARRR